MFKYIYIYNLLKNLLHLFSLNNFSSARLMFKTKFASTLEKTVAKAIFFSQIKSLVIHMTLF